MNKRTINYANEAACIADIERLESGYMPTGAWTLPQACWHCWTLAKDVFHPPASTQPNDEQSKNQKFINDVNANGWPAQQFPVAPGSSPPMDAGLRAVGEWISMLQRIERYPHSHIDHPFFGPVESTAFRKFTLIHAAHHLGMLVPTTHRRSNPRYADHAAMIADITRLRKGYTQGGNWSLAQICWHLNLGFPVPFEEVATQTELTEAQTTRQARWDHYIAHGHAPAGFEAPAEMIPPATCSDADIDALVKRLHDVIAFKGKFIKAAAGVMPIERARGFMLAHGWLHLSCLHPTHRRREHLSFVNEAAVINDVKKLRAGYLQAGKWSLEQVCWHLGVILPYPPESADANAPLTPHQQQGRKFLDAVKQHGGPPPGFEAPDALVPAATCDVSAIDDYLKKIEALSNFSEPYVKTDAFGPVETAFYRQLTIGHAARHLSFLRPIKSPRDSLVFKDEDAAIADIQRLRLGYEQVGGWSLPQVCWHLHTTMQARLKPGPHEPNTPEQDARKSVFERILETKTLPQGIVAPAQVTPPADAGDDSIDAAIATLKQMRDHQGDFAPHRLFGHAPNAITRMQNLIHVAHHLSHLMPIPLSKQTTTQTTKPTK